MLIETGRRDELIERLAAAIQGWGMTTPAVLFLEGKPFSFITSQLLFVAEPVLRLFSDTSSWHEYASLLEDGQNVERLLRQLEGTS